jgi:hypothetical protein
MKFKISFHGKSSDETRNRSNLHQHNNGYIKQAYSQYIFKWRISENISSKVRNEKIVSTVSILIQNSLGIPTQRQ